MLEAKVASTLASAAILKDRVSEAGAAVAACERAFDAFIERNITRIGDATGRADFLQMRDEIASLDSLRAQSSSLLGRSDSSFARRDWAAVAAGLGDEAIDNLERQRAALLGIEASGACSNILPIPATHPTQGDPHRRSG